MFKQTKTVQNADKQSWCLIPRQALSIQHTNSRKLSKAKTYAKKINQKHYSSNKPWIMPPTGRFFWWNCFWENTWIVPIMFAYKKKSSIQDWRYSLSTILLSHVHLHHHKVPQGSLSAFIKGWNFLLCQRNPLTTLWICLFTLFTSFQSILAIPLWNFTHPPVNTHTMHGRDVW